MSAAVAQRRRRPARQSGRDAILGVMETAIAASPDIGRAFLLEVARHLDTEAGIHLAHGNQGRAERLSLRAAEIRGGVR